MFGMEIWVIHQERNGEKYYYKGTENRGRRVWTKKKSDAFFFSDKADALNTWMSMGSIGVITGGFV